MGSQKTNSRIESIDLLRGIVMILMALDHTRDYFHLGAFGSDPTDLETTTPILFFTRFITHYCAPVFVFLAGTAAYLYSLKRSKSQLSYFLFTRGLWLIFVEIFINNFIWWFDINFGFFNLQVLWAIGWSMICLSVLVRLPLPFLLAVGVLIVAGHNLLDGISFERGTWMYVFWSFLHDDNFIGLGASRFIAFSYPVLPWIGVMILGYCFGFFYHPKFNAELRKKQLIRIGLVSIAFFFILRGLNVYGDLVPWTVQKDDVYTFISFFNVSKYPPSLDFLLITLGPSVLALCALEKIKPIWSKWVLVYGRVPFFYYLLHMLVIHLGAMIGLAIIGGDWRLMILSNDKFTNMEAITAYGYRLWVVYLVWLGVVVVMYPLCRWYMNYKRDNRDKWWLGYL